MGYTVLPFTYAAIPPPPLSCLSFFPGVGMDLHPSPASSCSALLVTAETAGQRAKCSERNVNQPRKESKFVNTAASLIELISRWQGSPEPLAGSGGFHQQLTTGFALCFPPISRHHDIKVPLLHYCYNGCLSWIS